MKELIDTLKVISKTGGIKISGSDNWINPTNEAKKDILNRLDEVKKLTNTRIKLRIDNNGNYVSIESLKEQNPITTSPKQEVWDKKDKRFNRSVAISYAKDLVIAGIIKYSELQDEAEKIFKFIQEC